MNNSLDIWERWKRREAHRAASHEIEVQELEVHEVHVTTVTEAEFTTAYQIGSAQQ
jgi:hypothetical protein